MRLRRTAVAIIAAAFALSACGGGDDDTGTEVEDAPSFEAGTTMAKLADAGKIRIGTKFDQPGFGFKGLENAPEGFDVEIAKIIAAKLGIEPDQIGTHPDVEQKSIHRAEKNSRITIVQIDLVGRKCRPNPQWSIDPLKPR